MDRAIRSMIASISGGSRQQKDRGINQRPQQFDRKFIPLPPAFWQAEDPTKLELGDKIVLPQSALDELSQMKIQFPIMFQIKNNFTNKISHCSVLQFTAPEGNVYLPLWVFDNLQMNPNSTENVITLRNVPLKKGTFVKFQPHTSDFTEISNPRALLEMTLRNFSCLTKGDTIQISPVGLGKTFRLDVVETRPEDQISIIETDVKVEFAEPLDYKSYVAAKSAGISSQEIEENKCDRSNHGDDVMGGLLGDVESEVGRKLEKKRYFSSLQGGYKLNGKPVRSKKRRKINQRVVEIVGKMRYIYELDGVTGDKTLIRRLPLRKKLGKGRKC